jgi:peptide/nickel transport system permease protein
MLSFPRQLFVLTVVAFFTNSIPLLVFAIAATSWMRIARLVRGEVIRLREAEFSRAALATGVSQARLLFRHILPNALGPTIVAATLLVGAVVLLEAYISFLGLGVQPPAPSWGAMVFEARDALVGAWWVPMFPAAAITICVVAFNLVGDGLRDALDVRLPAPRN